jgi:hypothetical protein
MAPPLCDAIVNVDAAESIAAVAPNAIFAARTATAPIIIAFRPAIDRPAAGLLLQLPNTSTALLPTPDTACQHSLH